MRPNHPKIHLPIALNDRPDIVGRISSDICRTSLPLARDRPNRALERHRKQPYYYQQVGLTVLRALLFEPEKICLVIADVMKKLVPRRATLSCRQRRIVFKLTFHLARLAAQSSRIVHFGLHGKCHYAHAVLRRSQARCAHGLPVFNLSISVIGCTRDD